MTQAHALIIDDNAKNVIVLANMLSEEDVSNTQLTNPKQLDALLQNIGKVDVVFLDLEMSGLDGYQVLQKLKSDPHFQGVPVVAYTVHVSEMHAANKGGFDGFIGKPLNADKFPEQLKRILSGKSVWETQ